MTETQKRYYLSPKGKAKKKQYNWDYNNNLRNTVLKHYSKGALKCACCGLQEIEFLTIDHIYGSGVQHRKKVGSGNTFYRWIVKNNFPKIFRVLCMNCNFSYGHYGYCPHKP